MPLLHRKFLFEASSPQCCSLWDWGEDTKSDGDAESYVSDEGTLKAPSGHIPPKFGQEVC